MSEREDGFIRLTYGKGVYYCVPNPKQWRLMNSTAPYVLYGGAMGGGKSFIFRTKAAVLSLTYPGIRCLILRKTFPELRENYQLPLQVELNGFAKWKDAEKAFVFPTGSRIRLGYCDTESDVLQYLGQEYDVMFIDEATQFTEYVLRMLTTRVRGVNDFPKRTYYASNPGGVGHSYMKRLFIDKQYQEGENPGEYEYIPATVYDNKPLMEQNPRYVESLKAMPEEQRKAYLDGDWNVFAGQYFSEWDPSLHVVEPFPLSPSWRRYITLDYGLDMLACYWVAVDEYGKAYVYRELYESGLIVSMAAAKIMETNKLCGESIFAAYGPPDLWNRRNDTGKSAFEIFTESGLYLSRATNERVQGWYNLQEWLHPAIDEQGKRSCALKIFRNCDNLIRCLPQLQYDKKNPNDIANEPHEITHGPDAIRYFVAGRPMPAQIPVFAEGRESMGYEREVSNFLNYGRA